MKKANVHHKIHINIHHDLLSPLITEANCWFNTSQETIYHVEKAAISAVLPLEAALVVLGFNDEAGSANSQCSIVPDFSKIWQFVAELVMVRHIFPAILRGCHGRPISQ